MNILCENEKGNEEMSFCILKNGDFEEQDLEKFFKSACLTSNFHMMELLIKKGIKNFTSTLKSLCKRNWDYHVLKFLLKNKANPNICNKKGESLLMFLCTKGFFLFFIFTFFLFIFY